MVTGTKILTDFTASTANSIDTMLKSFNTNLTNKSNFETNNKVNTKTTYKNENFNNVLNSQTSYKKQEDTNKIDELEEKLKELEKDSKSESKDKIKDILSELLNLLAKLGIKEGDLSNETINSDMLKGIVEKTGNKSSSNNLSSVMESIMELLKSDSVKENLDTNSLKLMEKILGNLSANISDDNSKAAKGIKGLMSEISNMLENKQNPVDKILTLEDMLSKNYSQDDSSSENQGDNSATSKDSNKLASKEDKFLSSLVDDNKDDSLNKINLFASRTSTIQNQSVNTARGLTINKATFVDDLIKDVKFMNTNSLKELTVKVNPGNLGEITIKLVQEDGLMKANLKANSKETAALLSQSLVDIKKQLGEQNLKIADVNIELYQDTTFFKEQQGFGGQLSEEQGRSNDRNSGTGNNLAVNEEESTDNITGNDSNIVEAFV